jgi:replicative DNA helicase
LELPAVDLTLLIQKLTDQGKLEEAGGPAALTDILHQTPTAAHFEHWLDVVDGKSRLRAVIGETHAIRNQAYDVEEPHQFLDDVEARIGAVTRVAATRNAAKNMLHGSQVFFDRFAARLDADTHGVTGIPTGLGKLDKYITGLHPLFYLIAARPSIGKTVLLMDFALMAALTGTPVAFFSLEQSLEELMDRAYSNVAHVPSMAIRTGQVTPDEHTLILSAHAKLSRAPLYVHDQGGIDILELRRRARLLVRRHGVKAIFVDYAQLVQSHTKRAQQNDIWRLDDVSNGLKNLQRELNVAVVAAAQLNRDIEKRGDNAKPHLSDLKGCGSFEQDADAVLMIWRNLQAETREDRCKTELSIVKQRHGPLGKIPLTFLEEFYHFASAAE